MGFSSALNLVYALASFPIGHIADRTSKRVLLASGYVIFALACVASIFESASLPTLAVVFILAGLQVAIVDTVESAYAADLLGVAQRGSGFGALQTVSGIGDLTSSTLIGVMLTYSSPQIGFGLTTAIAVAGAGVLLGLTRNRGGSDSLPTTL